MRYQETESGIAKFDDSGKLIGVYSKSDPNVKEWRQQQSVSARRSGNKNTSATNTKPAVNTKPKYSEPIGPKPQVKSTPTTQKPATQTRQNIGYNTYNRPWEQKLPEIARPGEQRKRLDNAVQPELERINRDRPYVMKGKQTVTSIRPEDKRFTRTAKNIENLRNLKMNEDEYYAKVGRYGIDSANEWFETEANRYGIKKYDDYSRQADWAEKVSSKEFYKTIGEMAETNTGQSVRQYHEWAEKVGFKNTDAERARIAIDTNNLSGNDLDEYYKLLYNDGLDSASVFAMQKSGYVVPEPEQFDIKAAEKEAERIFKTEGYEKYIEYVNGINNYLQNEYPAEWENKYQQNFTDTFGRYINNSVRNTDYESDDYRLKQLVKSKAGKEKEYYKDALDVVNRYDYIVSKDPNAQYKINQGQQTDVSMADVLDLSGNSNTEFTMSSKDMSEKARNTFNYLKSVDVDAAKEYYSAYEKLTRVSRNQNKNESFYQFGKEHWGLAGAANVAASTVGGLVSLPRQLYQVASEATGGEYMPPENLAALNPLLSAKNAMHQGALEGIDSNAGKFLYNTAISTVNNVAGIALYNKYYPLIMSLNAAGEETHSGLERGLSKEAAIMNGAAVGAIEYLTEKMFFDDVMEVMTSPMAKGSASKIRNIAKAAVANTGSEFGEEFTGKIAQNIADQIISGDKSEFNRKVNENVANGMNRDEAVQNAFMDLYVWGSLENGLAGAISGSILGGANNYSYVSNVGASVVNSNIGDVILTRALSAPKGTSTYTAAEAIVKKLQNGERVDNYQYGLLKNAMSEDGVKLADADMTPTDKLNNVYLKKSGGVAGTVAASRLSWSQYQYLDEIGRAKGKNIIIKDFIGNDVEVDDGNGGKTKVHFADADNGYYDMKTGDIYISANSENPLLATARHEIFHPYAQTEAGQKYIDKINNIAKRQNKEAYDAKINGIKRMYKNRGSREIGDLAREEFAADAAWKMMSRFTDVVKLTNETPSIAQKIKGVVVDLLNTIEGANAKINGVAGNVYDGMTKTQLQNIRRNFEMALGQNIPTVSKTETVAPAGATTNPITNTANPITNTPNIPQTQSTPDITQVLSRYSFKNNILDNKNKSDIIKTEQYRATWTIEAEILTNQDLALFYQEIGKLNYRGKNNYHTSAYGEYIFEIGNKLIYTDGKYEYPTITQVITFDSVYENEIEIAKEWIFSEEQSESEIYDAIGLIKATFGEGYISKTSFEDYRANSASEDGKRKRNNSRTNTKKHEQVENAERDITKVLDKGGKRSAKNKAGAGEVNLSETDKVYMNAVRAGDTETAQRMVDEAAKRAGYNIRAYHGTSKGGFTVFDTFNYVAKYGLFGNGAYFTEDADIAQSYTKKGKGNNPQVYDTYLSINNPIDMDAEANVNKWNSVLTRYSEIPTRVKSGETNEEVFRNIEEDLNMAGLPTWEVEEIIRSIFESMGYDGITYIGGGRVNADSKRHRVWIAFYEEQIKSANPATYDNDGNIIPLSERFNRNRLDIRYSIKENPTEAKVNLPSETDVSVASDVEDVGKFSFKKNVDSDITKILHKDSEPDVKSLKEILSEMNMTEEEFYNHTPEMQKVIIEYQNSVDSGVIKYANDVRKNGQNKKIYKLNVSVEKKGSNKISDLVGFDVDDFEVALHPTSIKHIDKRHGILGKQDSSMKNDNDLARIGYVIKNYDNVSLEKTRSQAFTDRTGKSSKKIKYEKRIDGTYYVIEAVPDTNKKLAYVISAYKTKAVNQPLDVQASQVTSENELINTASDDIISQESQKSNTFSENKNYSLKSNPATKATVYLPGEEHSGNVAGDEEEDNKKTSAVYKNSIMDKDTYKSIQSEAEARKPEFMYDGITNKETYNSAQGRVKRRGEDRATADLLAKAASGDAWTADDTAAGLALMAHYQTNGDPARAVDIASAMRQKLTQAGQAIQAMAMIDKLTPEGKFIAVSREAMKANKVAEEQLKKKMDKDKDFEYSEYEDEKEQIKKLKRELRRLEARKAELDDEIENGTEDDSAEDSEPNIVDVLKGETKPNKVNKSTKQQLEEEAELENKLSEMETKLEEAFEEYEIAEAEKNAVNEQLKGVRKEISEIKAKTKKDLQTAANNEQKIKEAEAEREKLFDDYIAADEIKNELSEELRAIRKEISEIKAKTKGKLKQAENTEQRIQQAEMKLKEVQAEYDKVLAEANAMKEKLKAKKEEIAALKKEIDRVKRNAQASLNRLKRNIASIEKSKITIEQIGKEKELLQRQQTIEEIFESFDVPYMSEDRLAEIQQTFHDIENLNNVDDLIELILRQSKERGTVTSKTLRKALKKQKVQFLKDVAAKQLFGMVQDLIPPSFSRRIATYQTIAHLFNLRTQNRNVTSNVAFNGVETIANNIAVGIDMALSLFPAANKQRTVGFDRGAFEKGHFKASSDKATRKYIDIALDVNTEADISGYMQQKGRTFRGKYNPLTYAERYMSYGLGVTDEFTKGGVEHNIYESLSRLKNAGYTDEEIREIAREEARYRTFQDDNIVSKLFGRLKKALNTIGNEEFGLGDFVMKYTQVPGALLMRSFEFSPLGYIKFITTTAKAIKAKELTPKQQRDIALSIGRATTGTGLIFAFCALARLGLLINEDDEEDKEVKNVNKAEGLSGTQINLSGVGRLITGGAPARQYGDVLVSVGFLEPLSSLMTKGIALSKADQMTAKDWARVITASTFEELATMSTMQSLRDIMGAAQYGTTSLADTAVTLASSWITGFIPAPIRQTASFIDGIQRDPYHAENSLNEVAYRVLSGIPFASKTVPAKVTPFGDEKVKNTGRNIFDFLNNYTNPGYVTIYQGSEVSAEAKRLYKYNDGVLPKTPPTSLKVDGQKYEIKGKDYERWSKMLGKNTEEAVKEYMQTEEYQLMADQERAEKIADIVNEVYADSKEQYIAEKIGTSKTEYDMLEDDMKAYSKASGINKIPGRTYVTFEGDNGEFTYELSKETQKKYEDLLGQVKNELVKAVINANTIGDIAEFAEINSDDVDTLLPFAENTKAGQKAIKQFIDNLARDAVQEKLQNEIRSTATAVYTINPEKEKAVESGLYKDNKYDRNVDVGVFENDDMKLKNENDDDLLTQYQSANNFKGSPARQYVEYDGVQYELSDDISAEYQSVEKEIENAITKIIVDENRSLNTIKMFDDAYYYETDEFGEKQKYYYDKPYSEYSPEIQKKIRNKIKNDVKNAVKAGYKEQIKSSATATYSVDPDIEANIKGGDYSQNKWKRDERDITKHLTKPVDDVVASAEKYIGTPYKWGGTKKETGFDCSGLMQCVFAENGIKINRTAREQFKNGTPVEYNNLEKGDLVFFKGSTGTASAPGHVGLYIGSGQFLHAPQTGETVKISDINKRKDYVGARRIIE